MSVKPVKLPSDGLERTHHVMQDVITHLLRVNPEQRKRIIAAVKVFFDIR